MSPVVLTGFDLALDEVLRVARDHEAVEIAPEAIRRMRASRDVVEAALRQGEAIYGLTTGVGVLKRIPVSHADLQGFDDRLIRFHRVAQGRDAPPDVARAAALRLANAFASGSPGVRPELADRLVEALNSNGAIRVRTLGSIGQADLASMADLATSVLEGFELAPGEGLAILNNDSFSTGWAALALWDAVRLADSMDVSGALSLEGFAANLSVLHPAVAETRPYPGLRRSHDRLRYLLGGSYLWEPDAARNLQDPLTFRNLANVQGACRDALDHALGQLAIELNASQGNPIVVVEEGRVVGTANFEILPLAAAIDYVKIVLASAITSAGERVVKMLETPWPGLPTGLAAEEDTPDPGLSYLGIATQSLVAEARLLGQPVSFELASTAHAEGIEDRMTMAPLAARRLAEMIDLGCRVVACEGVVAAQAVEVRGVSPLGRGTEEAVRLIRRLVPFLESGDTVPDMEPVVDLVRSGGLAQPG